MSTHAAEGARANQIQPGAGAVDAAISGIRRRTWPSTVLVGCVLFAAYWCNGRQIGIGDTLPNLMLPVAVLRGDGLVLDRFVRGRPAYEQFYAFAEKRGHLVSRYPIVPGLLAIPLTAPLLLQLDRRNPSWETTEMEWGLSLMAKLNAAVTAALAGVATYRVLLALELGPLALIAALIAGLGSTMWVIASQSPWQHGPVALFFALTVLLLLPDRRSRGRLTLAGLCAGLVTACRPQDIVLVAAVGLWVVARHRYSAAWFLLCPLFIATAVAATNWWYFGTPVGGYGELVGVLVSREGGAFFADDVVGSAIGTLFSPSRGLFVFMPWTALALAALPATYRHLARWPVLPAALCGLALLFVRLSLESHWWGGWNFGPRYWTDVVPVFAILLGFALQWSWRRARAFFAALVVAGAFAIAVQAAGAFCYPTTWTQRVSDPNMPLEAVAAVCWDWRDSEITRCLRDPWHPIELW